MNFESMLKRGLGRAVLFLQSHDPKPYRRQILYACSNFVGYDAQTEPSRGQYLFDIIQATSEWEYYAPRVREMLIDSDKTEMPGQVFELAAAMAKNGDEQAHAAMYQAFAQNAAKHDYTGAEELVDVDGIQGYVSVAEQWLKFPLTEDDAWFEGYLLDAVEKRFGVEFVGNAFAPLRQSEKNVASYLTLARERRSAWKASRRGRPAFVLPAYHELKAMIADPQETTRWFRWRRYGQKADEEMLLHLAADLLAEGRRDPLLKYLHLFRERRFPLDCPRLLELAKDSDAEIATAARSALSHITDARVRMLALELAASSETSWEVVNLLARNHHESDYELIGELLEGPQSDDHSHRLGISVGEWVKAHPTPDAAPLLVMLYEKGLCSICRRRAVELLLSLAPLPRWMLEECRYDADLETRKTVAAFLN